MELKPGEIKCEACKGTGYDLRVPEHKANGPYYQKHCKCDICHGAGKLDWVEAVVGKRKKDPFVIDMDFASMYPNTMPELKASDIINVQPMTSSTGDIFKS